MKITSLNIKITPLEWNIWPIVKFDKQWNGNGIYEAGVVHRTFRLHFLFLQVNCWLEKSNGKKNELDYETEMKEIRREIPLVLDDAPKPETEKKVENSFPINPDL